MNTLTKLILSCLAIALSAWISPGVSLPPLASSGGLITLVIVAIVLALLNTFIKPIFKLLAFPVTILTLGLFLFVINASIILLCAWLVDGFAVNGFLYALLFSFILSIITWLINKFL